MFDIKSWFVLLRSLKSVYWQGLPESFKDALREYSIRYTDSEGVEHEGIEREIKGLIEVGGEFADLYAISQEQSDAIL